MKSCERYELLASLTMDGEASEEERAELASHLETCPACRAYLADLRRIHDAFTVEEIAPPEDFAVRVMDRVRATKQDRPGDEAGKVIPFPHWKRWTALAACCAVVAVGLWTFHRTNLKDATVSTDIALQAEMGTRSVDGGGIEARDTDMSAASDGYAAEEPDTEASEEETPEAIPEEYEELAKSAMKDGEAEGQYLPLSNDPPEAGQEPAAASAPPASADSGGESDLLPASYTRDTERTEPEADIEEQPEQTEGDAAGAETPDLEEALPEAPEEALEPSDLPELPDEQEPVDETAPADGTEPVDEVEPVEVLGLPESGILIAYGSVAQNWVETVLELEWAIGGSYPLTADQYGDLLRTLDESGEPYTIVPGEGYCLMTE